MMNLKKLYVVSKPLLKMALDDFRQILKTINHLTVICGRQS
jgi:hypothetical protein